MTSKSAYVPSRGDAVWVTLDPQAGHEQRGRRPALVLSPAGYNRKVKRALVCPITGQVKGYPFEVPLPAGLPVAGAVLADQIKSLDWVERQCDRICMIPQQLVVEVLRRLNTLLDDLMRDPEPH